MRPIDADKLLPNGVFFVSENNPMASIDELLERIKNAPTIDLVKRGKWIMSKNGWVCYCSECKSATANGGGIYDDPVCSNYCMNCGAKMTLDVFVY